MCRWVFRDSFVDMARFLFVVKVGRKNKKKNGEELAPRPVQWLCKIAEASRSVASPRVSNLH